MVVRVRTRSLRSTGTDGVADIYVTTPAGLSSKHKILATYTQYQSADATLSVTVGGEAVHNTVFMVTLLAISCSAGTATDDTGTKVPGTPPLPFPF